MGQRMLESLASRVGKSDDGWSTITTFNDLFCFLSCYEFHNASCIPRVKLIAMIHPMLSVVAELIYVRNYELN
jgi:hypothetical protein